MKIILGALVIIVFIGWSIFGGLMSNYSDGQRTGDVYKFSKKGMFSKSWEGEMYLGGFSSDSNGQLQVEKFYFSLPGDTQNTEAVEKLQTCAKERKNCTVHYDQWLKSPWYIDSSYIVKSVEVSDKK